MAKLQYTPDEEIRIHRESAIWHLAGRFASHEAGMPEWAKNSADAYVRAGAPPEHRVVVLIFDDRRRGTQGSVSCLDFVGMTSRDLERYFRHWMHPDAARAGSEAADVLGGHGHGGKSYMIQMFEEYAYVHTVRDGKGCRYGVPAGEVRFGYIPSRDEGRDFAVPDPYGELGSALATVRVDVADLPEGGADCFARTQGFTLVRGVRPKGYVNRIRARRLLDRIVWDAQMVATLQLCKVYAVVNARLWNGGQPLALPEIRPIPGEEEPRVVAIPDTLSDPVSGERVSTTADGLHSAGELVLRTSEKSMRWRPRVFRHHIRFIASRDHIGQIELTELGVSSSYRDKIYGECFLDALEEYKQSDRRRLTESQLTRGLNEWIREEVDAYCRLFETRDRRIYDQKERDALSRMNAALDQWKNRFLDEMVQGLWGGEDGGVGPDEPRPLPAGAPESMLLTLSHSMAGVGVGLRPTLKFFDADRNRLRPVPYTWVSSDNNVAMVDEDLLIVETFSFGTTHLHAETMDGTLRSNRVPLEVVHIHSISVEPQEVELPAGSRHRLNAVCTLSNGVQTADLHLVWDVNDESIARVSSAGLVYAFEPGETQVYALDERHTSASPATIRVIPATEGGPGGRRARGYPRVLVSEIDRDPETNERVRLSREDPPVYQRVQDVDRNIWWINSACPLARLYLTSQSGYGYESREWRIYHLERYIEIMAKIGLSLGYELAHEMSHDIWTSRWDEIAGQMQERAAASLQEFISTGELPGG